MSEQWKKNFNTHFSPSRLKIKELLLSNLRVLLSFYFLFFSKLIRKIFALLNKKCYSKVLPPPDTHKDMPFFWCKMFGTCRKSASKCLSLGRGRGSCMYRIHNFFEIFAPHSLIFFLFSFVFVASFSKENQLRHEKLNLRLFFILDLFQTCYRTKIKCECVSMEFGD